MTAPAPVGENEDRTAAAVGEARPDPGGNDAAPIVEVGGLFFADLVRVHYMWERELAERDATDRDRLDELEEAYRDKLKDSRDAEGDILEAYWCILKPSAVALTEKPRTRMDRFLGEYPMRLHRVSNWLMPRRAEKLVDMHRSSVDAGRTGR